MNKTTFIKTKQPPMKLLTQAPEGKHQFWMVYVGGKDQPKRKHPTLAEAVAQATNLCRQNRNRKVYILESIGVFIPEWVDIRDKKKLAELEARTDIPNE